MDAVCRDLLFRLSPSADKDVNKIVMSTANGILSAGLVSAPLLTLQVGASETRLAE